MKTLKSIILSIRKLLKKKAKVRTMKPKETKPNYDKETDWLLSLDEHETKISS